MHTVHAGFSFVCPVTPEGEVEARKVLRRMRERADEVFARAPSTHFINGDVLPAQMRGKRELPATLLFLTSYWGPTRTHLDELVAVAGKDLRELFSHCRDAPEPRSSDADLIAYMVRHRRPDTFYSGMHHVTHRDVRDEQRLRREIEGYVDRNAAAFARLGPLEVRSKIQEFVRSQPALATASQPPTRTRWDRLVMHRHVLVLGVFAVLLGLATVGSALTRSSALDVAARTGWISFAAVIGVLVSLFVLMGYYEWRYDDFVAPRQPDGKVKLLEQTQLNPVINEMIVAGPIKLGFWRPLFLRVALWIVARYVTTAKITIPTVATARWLAIDGGKRLVFVSNFTNMAEGYVRDFIDIRNGALRINLVFGWGHGYPKTLFSIGKGAAADSNGFIHVVHMQQRVTDFWYCPYKDLSIDNITRNRKLREELFDDKEKEQAQQWLRLL